MALLTALQRKDKGLFYFETHSGRGAYDLSLGGTEAEGGVSRFSANENNSEELRRYAQRLEEYRAREGSRRAYPGSPLLAASELRPQDRAVLVELVPAEARVLEAAVAYNSQMRVEQGDGFERLRAWLPPAERRGLTFIDPPYEETTHDFERVSAAIVEALRRSVQTTR